MIAVGLITRVYLGNNEDGGERSRRIEEAKKEDGDEEEELELHGERAKLYLQPAKDQFPMGTGVSPWSLPMGNSHPKHG